MAITTPVSSSSSPSVSQVSYMEQNKFSKFINCLNSSYNINIQKIIILFLFVYFILFFFIIIIHY